MFLISFDKCICSKLSFFSVGIWRYSHAVNVRLCLRMRANLCDLISFYSYQWKSWNVHIYLEQKKIFTGYHSRLRSKQMSCWWNQMKAMRANRKQVNKLGEDPLLHSPRSLLLHLWAHHNFHFFTHQLSKKLSFSSSLPSSSPTYLADGTSCWRRSKQSIHQD